MPTEFQKLVVITLANVNSVFVYRRHFDCNQRNPARTIEQSERSNENSGRTEFTNEGRKIHGRTRKH